MEKLRQLIRRKIEEVKEKRALRRRPKEPRKIEDLLVFKTLPLDSDERFGDFW